MSNDPALIIALACFTLVNALAVVAIALGLWWSARTLSAIASGALNLKQVRAFDPLVAEDAEPVTSKERVVAPPPVEGALNTRTRLSDLSDAELAAAVQNDVKVITFDENAGIDDAEPIPRGGRGVYAK